MLAVLTVGWMAGKWAADSVGTMAAAKGPSLVVMWGISMAGSTADWMAACSAAITAALKAVKLAAYLES
jgi:hypothetical protein